MTKILKKIRVPKTDANIYKSNRSKFWYVRFYVNRNFSSDGMFKQSLKLTKERDAIKSAQQIYKKFWIENEIKDEDTKVVRKIYKFDAIAKDFIKIRIKEKGTEGQRELGKWNNHFVHYFGGLDIREMDKVNEQLIDSLLARREEGNAPQTLIKYQQLISNICKYARKKGLINYEPTLMKINRIASEVPPYEHKEIEVLSEASRKLCRDRSDPFYDDLSDYIQFCRSALIRPGIEVLRIKHKHIHTLSHTKFKDKIMIVVNGVTKTGKIQNVQVHPMFKQHIFENRILKRRPDAKPNDYLFFPFLKDRDKLVKTRQRVSNNFRFLAVKCELYIDKNENKRPMYSLRHSALMQRLESGVAMQFVAEKGNTSPEMIKLYYEDVRNQDKMFNDHLKLFPEYYKNK